MRVTVLSAVGAVGGAERVLLAGLRTVPEYLPGVAFTVIMLADGPLRGEVERTGAKAVVVPLPGKLGEVGDTQLRSRSKLGSLVDLARGMLPLLPGAAAFQHGFRVALRHSRPDLVHSHGLKTHLLTGLVRPAKVPVVWHLHDFYSERPLAGRALRALRRRMTLGVAVSAAVQRDAAQTLPGRRIVVVHNAVDVQHFTPDDVEGTELDRLAGLPPAGNGTIRVGLVATYANWKGQGMFLDALARLPRDVSIRGYVIGGPIYATAGSQVTKAELVERASANGLTGRVGFIDFQPDPADVYRRLDVVVHASTRPEPFGLTVTEAMSCGRAVIVAASGGAIELFTDGHDALAHPPGDVAALARQIERLASDAELRGRLGGHARRTALEKFALPRFGREMAAAYRAALK